MSVVTSDIVTFTNVMQVELSDSCIKKLADALKQKTGKWIVHTEIKNAYGGIYIECSECGESYVVQHLDAEIFCRTCGSKNGR